MASQEKLAQLRSRETIGGKPTTPSGPVRFVDNGGIDFKVEADQNMRNAFGSVIVDGRTVSERLDAYFRAVVEDRCNELHALDKIPAVMDRRIEVAVNAAVDGLRVEMVAIARAHMIERIKAAVDALPLNVAVQIGATP